MPDNKGSHREGKAKPFFLSYQAAWILLGFLIALWILTTIWPHPEKRRVQTSTETQTTQQQTTEVQVRTEQPRRETTRTFNVELRDDQLRRGPYCFDIEVPPGKAALVSWNSGNISYMAETSPGSKEVVEIPARLGTTPVWLEQWGLEFPYDTNRCPAAHYCFFFRHKGNNEPLSLRGLLYNGQKFTNSTRKTGNLCVDYSGLYRPRNESDGRHRLEGVSGFGIRVG
jgi:hypothetical protein